MFSQSPPCGPEPTEAVEGIQEGEVDRRGGQEGGLDVDEVGDKPELGPGENMSEAVLLRGDDRSEVEAVGDQVSLLSMILACSL